MIVRCPDCAGCEDRPDDLCGMCSDPGVMADFCLHERYEKGNAECVCEDDCERCGTGLDEHGECWQCDQDSDSLGETREPSTNNPHNNDAPAASTARAPKPTA